MIALSRSRVPGDPELRPLTPEAALKLVLPWGSAFTREELAEHCGLHATLSWHVPGSNHFLVAGEWRRRRDIVEVLASLGDRSRPALWTALLEHASAQVVLVDPLEYRDHREFYLACGVRELDGVVGMQLGRVPQGAPLRRLLAHRAGPPDAGAVTTVDSASFPWLWRNSPEEFREYVSCPSVTVLLFELHGEPVGYCGYTLYTHSAHIDRLAVSADHQGHGYGREIMDLVFSLLRRAGCVRATLTTQRHNAAAQALYRRLGFARTQEEYSLCGTGSGPELD